MSSLTVESSPNIADQYGSLKGKVAVGKSKKKKDYYHSDAKLPLLFFDFIGDNSDWRC